MKVADETFLGCPEGSTVTRGSFVFKGSRYTVLRVVTVLRDGSVVTRSVTALADPEPGLAPTEGPAQEPAHVAIARPPADARPAPEGWVQRSAQWIWAVLGALSRPAV